MERITWLYSGIIRGKPSSGCYQNTGNFNNTLSHFANSPFILEMQLKETSCWRKPIRLDKRWLLTHFVGSPDWKNWGRQVYQFNHFLKHNSEDRISSEKETMTSETRFLKYFETSTVKNRVYFIKMQFSTRRRFHPIENRSLGSLANEANNDHHFLIHMTSSDSNQSRFHRRSIFASAKAFWRSGEQRPLIKALDRCYCNRTKDIPD